MWLFIWISEHLIVQSVNLISAGGTLCLISVQRWRRGGGESSKIGNYIPAAAPADAPTDHFTFTITDFATNITSRSIWRRKNSGGSSFPAPPSFIWYSGEWIGLGQTQMLHHHLPLTVGSFHLFRFSTFEMSTLILWMPVSNPNVTRVASEPQLTRQERRSDFSFHQSPPNSEEHLLVKSSEKDAKTLTPPKITVGIVIFVTSFPFPISLKPKDHFHFIGLKPVSALSCQSVSRLVEFCSICWICQSC